MATARDDSNSMVNGPKAVLRVVAPLLAAALLLLVALVTGAVGVGEPSGRAHALDAAPSATPARGAPITADLFGEVAEAESERGDDIVAGAGDGDDDGGWLRHAEPSDGVRLARPTRAGTRSRHAWLGSSALPIRGPPTA